MEIVTELNLKGQKGFESHAIGEQKDVSTVGSRASRY